MSQDQHTPEQGPGKPLSAPVAASDPRVGASRRSEGLSGPQTGAESFGALKSFVLWLDASDGSVPTHDGIQWPDGTVTIHHRHFGISTTHRDPDAARQAAHGKQGRIVWPAPAPADALRQRIAEALYQSHWPRGRWELRPTEEHDLYREHAEAVLAVVQPELDALAALRQVARGYCPACGRGDAAPTVEDYEQQRQRAEQAEAWRRKAVRRALKISKLQGTLAAVTDLRDDLREITGARWIADALDKILDGQPPAHDAGPTVREAAAADRAHWGQRQWGGE